MPFVCLDSFGLGTTAANILNDLIDGNGYVQYDPEIPIAVNFVDTPYFGGNCTWPSSIRPLRGGRMC